MLFPFCGTELRGKEVYPHPKGISAGTRQRIDFLPCNQRGCLWICRLADGIFCQRGQCRISCRCRISPGRRGFLCWNRYFVFALWILPRSGQAGCLGGSYHNLTGNKSNSCLCTHTGLFHTGVIGIWAAIPIGWGLADLVGMVGIVSSFRGHFFGFHNFVEKF